MPIEHVEKDLKTVLEYLWRDEKRHYSESSYPRNHIFCVLKRLAKAVKYEY
jgi:hypothetical protein